MATNQPRARCLWKMLGGVALPFVLMIPMMAQDNSQDKSKVIAMEKAWNQAFKSRDGRALGPMLDDSIVLVDDDGRLVSKLGFLTGIDTAKPSANQQDNPESIEVRFFGNVAVATGIFRESGFEHGKAFVRRNRFVDTWIRNGGWWQCVAASATPISQ